MPVSSPFVIVLTDPERRVLSRRARSTRTSYRDRIRARIVLAAGDGAANAVIARQVGVGVDTVRKWRRRFVADRLGGLRDASRPGRPRRLPDTVRAQVIALACELPATSGVALSRWSSPELARELAARTQVQVSASTVRRWLAADALKPWQHRSWISIRDPDFVVKAARVLDLYARLFDGVALGADEYVLCADEKSQLQALARRHPELPPGPGRTRRVEFEYTRGGTLAYFGAYDVHRARLFDTVAPTTGIVWFEALVAKVMHTEPYASASRVFWIVDNGSSHNGARSVERMHTTWPTCELVHLPVHASWLNQIEIVFSILARKALRPADFADLAALTERLTAFAPRFNATAVPFDWRFGRTELTDLCRRLDAHRPDGARPLAA